MKLLIIKTPHVQSYFVPLNPKKKDIVWKYTTFFLYLISIKNFQRKYFYLSI